jgi:hypothetical protein
MSSLLFRRTVQYRRIVQSAAPSVSRITRFSSSDTKDFHYQELFDLSADTDTPYRKLTGDHVSTFEANGIKFLKVEPEALRLLTATAMVCN